MQYYRLDQWCRKAVSGIRYEPDRYPVLRKLFQEAQEQCNAYIRQGLSPRDAESRVLEELGPAENRIASLAADHPPFHGYLLRWTRRVFILLLTLAVVSFGIFVIVDIYLIPAFQRFDEEDHYPFAGEYQALMDIKPNVRARSDGYAFILKRAVHYRQTLGGEEQQQLNLQVHSRNPLPWAENPEFSGWFWAVDSLGNYYYAENQDSVRNTPAIRVTDYRRGFFTTVHDFWLIPYLSQEAEWIELHYDRDGRAVVLHLELTGGAGK